VIVVSDASPLISLAVVGFLDVLRSLYGRVIIPEAVYQEITAGVSGLPGALAIQELEWIVSQPVQNGAVVRALQGELDHGEAEAIALVV
jgi:predicted nucleic acid-binding protein